MGRNPAAMPHTHSTVHPAPIVQCTTQVLNICTVPNKTNVVFHHKPDTVQKEGPRGGHALPAEFLPTHCCPIGVGKPVLLEPKLP